MNRLIDPLMTGEKVYVQYTSTGIPVAWVNGGWKPDIVPPEQMRRAIRLMKEHKLIGDSPPFPKPTALNVRAALAKRKSVARKPLMVRTVKARVFYTDSDGNKVELEPSSASMYFDADSAPTDGDDEEEVGSVSKRPAEDSTMVGGSVLKRPRVDQASQVLVGNLNPGQDSSATGTIEEVKSGSVINKDLGGSSENRLNNLNPGADPVVDASSDT